MSENTDTSIPAENLPSTPPRLPPLSHGNSLEEKLRGMIIHNSAGQLRNPQDFSPMHPPPPPMPVTPDYEGQFHDRGDYNISLPLSSPGFDSHFFQNSAPAQGYGLRPLSSFEPLVAPSQKPFNSLRYLNISGPQQPGSQFGALLPPLHTTQLPPSHGPPFNLVQQQQKLTVPPSPQNQSPTHPPSSPRQIQVPQHMLPRVQHHSPPQRRHQQQIALNRQARLQEFAQPGMGELQFRHSPQQPRSDYVQRQVPQMPFMGLNDFPPLGTEYPKTVLPKPPPSQAPQTGTQGQTQNRIRYQPLEFQRRPVPQPKPSFHGPQVHSQAGAAQPKPASRNPQAHPQAGRGRMPPPPVLEQMIQEQSTNLEVFARVILAEARPAQEELVAQNNLLKKCREICRRVYPVGELVPFGSLVTGFATTNSDLDVILTTPDTEVLSGTGDENDEHAPLPQRLEKEFLSEGFEVILLTKTRVPILKLMLKATDEIPYELNCDIGFNNELGVHNTRMLQTYGRCDPRVKELVLFIKWWAKRRHINSPYRGTLSSYGFVLMIIHFLINVVKPPVLVNLQIAPIPEDAPPEQIFNEDGGGKYHIWYAKDIENLPKTTNQMHIGQLLRNFFEYYSFVFQWGREVISIRTQGGILSKQEKGWVAAVTRPGKEENSQVKDRYLFTIEDPFEISHNVGRTCNIPGVNRIRDEFKRAIRVIRCRDGGKTMTECLCQEAPPERPWVRREDREKMGGGKPGTKHDGNRETGVDGQKTHDDEELIRRAPFMEDTLNLREFSLGPEEGSPRTPART